MEFVRNKKSQSLPAFLQREILNLKEIIEQERFFLFGGAPIDYLFNGKKNFNDLDIAIEKKDIKTIQEVEQSLIKNNFNILSFREYIVQKKTKVFLLYATNNKLTLDICFLENFTLTAGLFNLDSLYCRFPEIDFIDRHDTMDGIYKKNIYPIRRVQKENPYLLFSKFIRLCSKYKILPLQSNQNKEILNQIKVEMEKNKNLLDVYQSSSCLNSIIKSVTFSSDRVNFLDDLNRSDVVKKIMPTLHKSFILASRDAKLSGVKSRTDLIFFLYNLLRTKKDKKIFLNLLSCLKVRDWDSEYIKLFKSNLFYEE